MPKNKIIIYSPSYLIRKGICHLIERYQNAQIIDELENIEDLETTLHNSDFDLLILDSILFKSKHEFISHINQIDKNKLLIVKTDNAQLKRFHNKIDINHNQDKILETLTHLIENTEISKEKHSIPEEISAREADILKYIAMGYSNKEIADKLFLSAHTVVTHRKNITRKLGIKTAPGLTIYAILNKIIDVNDAEKI